MDKAEAIKKLKDMADAFRTHIETFKMESVEKGVDNVGRIILCEEYIEALEESVKALEC